MAEPAMLEAETPTGSSSKRDLAIVSTIPPRMVAVDAVERACETSELAMKEFLPMKFD